jgi:hypothetical protein
MRALIEWLAFLLILTTMIFAMMILVAMFMYNSD